MIIASIEEVPTIEHLPPFEIAKPTMQTAASGPPTR